MKVKGFLIGDMNYTLGRTALLAGAEGPSPVSSRAASTIMQAPAPPKDFETILAAHLRQVSNILETIALLIAPRP